MSISNVNSALAAAYLNQLSTTRNTNIHGYGRNTCPTCQSFYSVLQSQMTNQNKQNALMPYRMNYYSGYNNLYALNGVNSYRMLQNSLYTSLLGGIY